MRMRKISAVVYCITAVSVILGAHWFSRTVTTLAEAQILQERRCIVLDPGHGGVDGGAISCTGKPESAYNLAISLRLRDLFSLLGIQTKMIRTEDISVYTKGETIAQKKVSDLKERVRIANSTDHGLLISIHQNQFPDSRYHGAQVFYGADEQSKLLAGTLQNAFHETVNPDTDRKAKRASGVYLMEHTEIPRVLIECGFLSNPSEEAQLRSEDYQKKLCCVIAGAVSQYLSNT